MVITAKIRMIIAAILLAVILSLGIGLGISVHRNHTLKAQYKEVLSNQTGYIRDLSAAKNDIHQYQLTIADLRYMNDSVTNKMLDLQNKLKIKDKHIQNLQYMASHFTKTDTVTFSDTIFIDQNLCLDTLVGDKWVSTRLHLEWPSIVAVEPSVTSEKTVAIYTKKETVKPPKKTWIGRLFQKKHRVTKVYIDESNPYIDSQQNEFIEVVK
jgi:hypothetical protein